MTQATIEWPRSSAVKHRAPSVIDDGTILLKSFRSEKAH